MEVKLCSEGFGFLDKKSRFILISVWDGVHRHVVSADAASNAMQPSEVESSPTSISSVKCKYLSYSCVKHMNFDLADLRAFLSVADLGSFRAASEAMFLSQSELSMRVDQH